MKSREELEKIARETILRSLSIGAVTELGPCINAVTEALTRVQDEALSCVLPSEKECFEACEKTYLFLKKEVPLSAGVLWADAMVWLRANMKPTPQERLSEVAIAETAVSIFDDTDNLYFDSFLKGYRAAEDRLLGPMEEKK